MNTRSSHRPSTSPRARCVACAVIAFCALCFGAPLWAATCSVSTTGLGFGVYDPLASTAATANGALTVTCSATKNNELRNGFWGLLTLSTGSSGSYAARTLRTATDTLRYNLYADAAYSTVLGDGSGGSQAQMLCYRGSRRDPCGGNGLNGGSPHNVTVYGQIPAGQDVGPGGFVDNLVATIAF